MGESRGNHMSDRLLTPYRVCELLGATPGLVAEWMRKGWLPFERLPEGPIRISRRSVAAFAKTRGMDTVRIPDEECRPAEAPAPPPLDAARQVVQAILRDAVRLGATDIHLQPQGDSLALQLRIDGVMRGKPHFSDRLPKGLAPRLLQQFKALGGLDPNETAVPQTGKLAVAFDGSMVHFHLAAFPTPRGEWIAIRLLDAPPAPGLAAPGPSRFDSRTAAT